MEEKRDKVESLIHSAFLDTYSQLSRREAAGGQTSKVLFVFFDAGETKALDPVVRELSDAQIKLQVLAFGTAWTLMRDQPFTINIHSFLHVSEEISQVEWKRGQPLDQQVLKKIFSHLTPDIVITGIVSEMQKQIAEGFKAQGADIIAFYDSFAPIQEFSFIAPLFKIASVVLVPSKGVADYVHSIDPEVKVDIVGQPVLEQWIENTSDLDPNETRSLIDITDDKPLLLYVSGYGEGYIEAFHSFAKAAQYVNHFHIGVALHPKMDGTVERKILHENDCQHVFFIPKEVDTSSVVALADLVVTWRSTVGVQAAFLGKPVVYLDKAGSTYTSLAIDRGWAVQLFDAAEFLKLLMSFEIEIIPVEQRFIEGGVPQNATNLIVRRIVGGNKKRSFIPRKSLDPGMIKIFQKRIQSNYRNSP